MHRMVASTGRQGRGCASGVLPLVRRQQGVDSQGCAHELISTTCLPPHLSEQTKSSQVDIERLQYINKTTKRNS